MKKIERSNKYEFVYPDKEGVLLFDPGENVWLACPGKGFFSNGNTLLKVKCVKNTTFRSENENKDEVFENYDCLSLPQSSLVRTGQCAGDKSAFQIGFEVDNVFIEIINLCFDEKIKSALYSKHKIMPNIAG